MQQAAAETVTYGCWQERHPQASEEGRMEPMDRYQRQEEATPRERVAVSSELQMPVQN